MPAPQKQDEEADPTPYLFVSLEQKRIDQSKPYDAKKACWIPDEKEGYLLGEIKATKGDIVSVGLPGGEVCIPLSLSTLARLTHATRSPPALKPSSGINSRAA